MMLSGEKQLQTTLSLDELSQHAQRVLLAKPESSVPDARVDDYLKPHRADWLWQTILREWPAYVNVMFASLISNVLGLSAMLFTMQVYDRVIPSQSVPSLWVLFGGVMIALTCVFVTRLSARISLIWRVKVRICASPTASLVTRCVSVTISGPNPPALLLLRSASWNRSVN